MGWGDRVLYYIPYIPLQYYDAAPGAFPEMSYKIYKNRYSSPDGVGILESSIESEYPTDQASIKIEIEVKQLVLYNGLFILDKHGSTISAVINNETVTDLDKIKSHALKMLDAGEYIQYKNFVK